MSGKAKRNDTSDIDGADDFPSKKTAKIDNNDDEDTIAVCEISKNRRVSVRNWNGKIVVDIREFYIKDGKQLPGKKGISLNMDQWKILREHAQEIDQVVAENN